MIYLILLLSLILRLYRLDALSLFGDEIDVGYHAWSLITTGRDYYGQFLPSYLHSLAEWRAPLLMYVTAPFVGLLGPSLWSVRLPIVLLGVANIYLLYLLTSHLFPLTLKIFKRLTLSVGEIAALILAITPWHLHYSRAAFEVTLLLTLLLLGTYWFFKQKNYFLIPFVLTFYTYSTANLFTPLFLIALYLIYKPSLRVKRSNLISYLLALITFIPILYQLTFGNAAGRFMHISIFTDPKIIESIILDRTEPWVNQTQEAIFHNKPLAYLSVIGNQYLQALSPQFLFFNGDPFFRHSISRFGELLWVTAPFLFLGLASVITNLKRKENQLILAWLLFAPLPSALTQSGGQHATRLFLLLPPLIILISLGLTQLNRLKANLQQFALSIFLLTALLNFTLYWHQYLTHYPSQSFALWHGGYQEAMTQLKPELANANKVYLNSTYQPSILPFVFYTKYPPKEFQKNFASDAPNEDLLPWFTGFALDDKYYFGQIKTETDLAKVLEPNDLYLAVQGKEIPGDWDWFSDPPKDLIGLYQIKDPLNQPLFTLVKLK